MPIDAYRNGNAFYVHFDLPGVDPASIDLTVEQNVLAVKAERLSIAADGAEMIVRELPAGTFTRQLFLGETLDADHIEADCNAGRLPSASRSWRRPSLASSSSPPTSTTSSCAAALSSEPHPPRLRPALGQRRCCSAGWGRHRACRPVSPVRDDRRSPTRSNPAKDASVWPWLSVVCSTSASSGVLPRISSSVKAAAPSVETITWVP